MIRAAVVALVALVACGPEWLVREGWANEGDPAAMPSNVYEVTEAAYRLAPCWPDPWGGWIVWHNGPFQCGNVKAAGCFTGYGENEARVEVVGKPYFARARDTALAHELGHYLYYRCKGDLSEETANAFALRVNRYLTARESR